MAGLSYSTAARIAWRELRSSRGKFAFVVLSVAIGVAALTGVRGFSSSFRSMLLLRARSIMAADLSARSNQQPTPDEQQGLDRVLATEPGLQLVPVTEMLSMASAANSLDPLLVSIKAVDPARYPFYGEVKLAPAEPLSTALTEDTVAVADDLLLRLHLHRGDSLKLGSRLFRIAAVVVDEPDRLSGSFAAGPRVLLSQQALESSGLLAPGSHATRRLLFKLAPAAGGRAAEDRNVARIKAQLEDLMPEAQIVDYREANPALTKALDGATGLLSLMSLVSLVLGAVGVAMAMRAHLGARLDAIAIMKSLGASSAHILRIYVLQTLLLGLVGGLLGLVLGLGVQLSFPFFLARLLGITPAFRLDPRVFALGLGAGLLTTLLFTLPPLLDIRTVRPILILRRNVEASEDPFARKLLQRLRGSVLQIVAAVLLLAGLAWLATRVSDSRQVGLYFAAGLALLLLVLFAMSALLLSGLRRLLDRTRLSLAATLRHGLANLYRPGNPSAALLAALGLGVMQIAAVYMVQRSVVNEMQTSTAANLPNLFLIDISSSEVEGVRSLLRAQHEVGGEPEFLPVVSSRLLAIEGTPAAELKLLHMPKRLLSSLNLTWAPSPDQPPPGDRVIAGQWWSAEQAANAGKHPLIAIERQQAARLNVRPGQHMTFAIQDDQFTATVAALYEPDSRHAFSRAEFVVPQAVLAGLPVIWYGGVHCDPHATSTLRRTLYERYPTVTVIDVAATLETVRQVLLQITYVIQFLAAFSIFAGIVILASAIAGTRYRRVREVVVLKTLGATRPRIAGIFSVEFAVLGLIAGAAGLLFANVLARLLLHRVFHFDYSFQPVFNAAAWLGTGLLTIGAGWLASYRVLGQKPLEILREE